MEGKVDLPPGNGPNEIAQITSSNTGFSIITWWHEKKSNIYWVPAIEHILICYISFTINLEPWILLSHFSDNEQEKK